MNFYQLSKEDEQKNREQIDTCDQTDGMESIQKGQTKPRECWDRPSKSGGIRTKPGKEPVQTMEPFGIGQLLHRQSDFHLL